jgi:Xaa-Pro aminopeptidase
MEYGGCYKRYTAPIMRSALLGEPDAETRRFEDAVLATVQAIIDAIRPGRSCHDVAVAAKRAHASIGGIAYFSGAYGYNVGVGFPPTWADGIAFIAEGVEEELRPGMTYHLPIAMRAPGRFGVSLSETLLVTEKGCELLTDHPRRLHVVDT